MYAILPLTGTVPEQLVKHGLKTGSWFLVFSGITLFLVGAIAVPVMPVVVSRYVGRGEQE